MESRHTPGPWKAYYAKNGKLLGVGVDRPGDDDHAVGITDYQGGLWGDDDEQKANAERIVAAVNCHDELLEALQSSLQFVEAWRAEYRGLRNDSQCKRIEAQIAKTEAAIARATGQDTE